MDDVWLDFANGSSEGAYLNWNSLFLLVQWYNLHHPESVNIGANPRHRADHVLESFRVHSLDKVADSRLHTAANTQRFEHVHDPYCHGYLSWFRRTQTELIPNAASTNNEVGLTTSMRLVDTFIYRFRSRS